MNKVQMDFSRICESSGDCVAGLHDNAVWDYLMLSFGVMPALVPVLLASQFAREFVKKRRQREETRVHPLPLGATQVVEHTSSRSLLSATFVIPGSPATITVSGARCETHVLFVTLTMFVVVVRRWRPSKTI